jgi:pantetheine-phosphate adenylyltransferase
LGEALIYSNEKANVYKIDKNELFSEAFLSRWCYLLENLVYDVESLEEIENSKPLCHIFISSCPDDWDILFTDKCFFSCTQAEEKTIRQLEDIIKRAAKEYDEVYAVIFTNPDKSYTFDLSERMQMLILATEDIDNCLASFSNGLVIDYMREHGIKTIVRGYRNETDLAYETYMANWNREHNPRFVTELIPSEGCYANVSSTDVRNAMKNREELSALVHPDVISILSRKNF